MKGQLHSLWPRCYALVDMVSFFASVEQLDYPHLKNKPVVVTNSISGTTIITSSYEARQFGIKTGMKIYDARRLCPHLIQRPSRPKRYVEISQAIIKSLNNITCDIEVFSIDECFLDLKGILHAYTNMTQLAEKIRTTIFEASGGLSCSIGISEGKLTAKFAAQLCKSKTTIIPPHAIAQVIAQSPIEAICGIGPNMAEFLHYQGIFRCGDMANIPIEIISKRYGNVGKRLYLTCLGHDPEPLKSPQPPKSIGHGKVLPPHCKDTRLIAATLQHQCEKVAARLRAHQLKSNTFFIGIKRKNLGWLSIHPKLSLASNHSDIIWSFAKKLLANWHGDSISQVQVTATHLVNSKTTQFDLFKPSKQPKQIKRDALETVKDAINHKFGRLSLIPANVLTCQNKDAVIAPSWQPEGSRQSIE